MAKHIDRRKSLQELEKVDWGEPTFDTYLVRTCHQLHRKPLDEFTAEDLRIMIGQQIGLIRLVPLALEHMEETPLVSGKVFTGDLLSALLRVDELFWKNNYDLRDRLQKVVRRITELMPTLDEIEQDSIRDVLAEATWLQAE